MDIIKWIFNKSLRFQIILVLVLVLSVPAAFIIWNVLVPSHVGTAVRSMQEEKLKSLLVYIDDNLDKREILGLQGSIENITKVEENINSSLNPLSKTVWKTSMGIYLPINKKNYIFGKLYDDGPHSKVISVADADQAKSFNESINQIMIAKLDKVDNINYRKREILRCFHPIISNGKVVAVAWADTLLPSELNYGKSLLIYIAFLGPVGFIVGFILMIAIVNNSNRNILKIGKGLVIMSHNLSYRIENTGGDIGTVVESINSMAELLENREKLEEHLQRAEKLASLGQMISGVAHEIRNPLGIIRGTVQLIGKNFKNIEGLDEYINIIIEQSDRENKVIQELLDYSRPSKQILMKMDINLIIYGILSFTNKYIQEEHVKLNLKLPDSLPEILLDADKIKQVFVNIILNACESMVSGGTLTIRTEKDGKWVKTYFEDTGIGMDDLEMKNIFNPYYTTKPKGTGLGLAISNGIIELSGGYIEVHSKKAEGSCFIVALPASYKGGEDNE